MACRLLLDDVKKAEVLLRYSFELLSQLESVISKYLKKNINFDELQAEVGYLHEEFQAELKYQRDTHRGLFLKDITDPLGELAGQLEVSWGLFIYGHKDYCRQYLYLKPYIKICLKKIQQCKSHIQINKQEILREKQAILLKKNLWKTIKPDFQNVHKQLQLLITKEATREQISDWAVKLILADNYGDKQEHVWKILKKIAGASLKKSPTEYVYSEENFREWIKELEQSV